MEKAMGTAKPRELPRCTAHRDCFANKGGVCVCLGDNDFHGKDCPFFKTTAQCDAGRQKSYERLVALGRTDLIEMYKVGAVYGSQ